MSGHSKWSTIKHKKEATDAARGKLFSKLSRAISVAVKTGGGDDPDANNKLRVAIDQARAANMPKDKIENAIKRAASSSENLEEVVYEGFGPGGISVIVEVTTDNKNRTAQEIKNLFERVGGNLGGPGSASFNFQLKGLIVVKKEGDFEGQMLKLIDIGAEDVEETGDNSVEVYVAQDKLSESKKEIELKGFTVLSSELYQKPNNLQPVSDEQKAAKALSFLESLEDHDDVQRIFSNLDIPQEVLGNLRTSK